MIVFLTITGHEFQTPGDSVEYKPQEKLGAEALFEVKQGNNWKPVAQVRACEVVGWYVVPKPEPGEVPEPELEEG